ncbi:MAG: hypothetical protein HMLKMBBP_01679 [Planctomycetes bacterium]|nr:hypothetical protein [Planctomycetota bacterium]
MTNAERLLLIRRARSELQRVRDELNLATASCPHCTSSLVVDGLAKQLDEDLDVVAGKLEEWVLHLSRRSPTSERVSSEP